MGGLSSWQCVRSYRDEYRLVTVRTQGFVCAVVYGQDESVTTDFTPTCLSYSAMLRALHVT